MRENPGTRLHIGHGLVHRQALPPRFLPLTAHHSLLTTHCSPRTAHHLPGTSPSASPRPRSLGSRSRRSSSVCQTGLEPRTSRPQPGGSATHMLEPRLGQVLWTRPRTRTRPSPRRRSSRPGRRRSSRPSARRRPPLPRPLPTVARADGRGLTAREFQGASSAPRDYRKPEPRGGRGSVDLEGVGLGPMSPLRAKNRCESVC